MFYRVEASSFDEAYKKAFKKFNCSILELDSKIIQNPSNGIFGFFKKSLIVEFDKKLDNSNYLKLQKESDIYSKKLYIQGLKIQKVSKAHFINISKRKVKKKVVLKSIDIDILSRKSLNIFDNFFNLKDEHLLKVCDSIESDLNSLFKSDCFKLKVKSIHFESKDTLFIHLDGEDAKLFEAKNGQIYDSFSYMIFSFINDRYSLSITLEVGSFLKKSKENLIKELAPLIARVNKYGNGKSKPMDGVFLHLALSILRASLPNKYIVAKKNSKNQKIIVID
jgi:spoIIIJ-associated protein